MVYACTLCVHWAVVVVTIHRVWHLYRSDICTYTGIQSFIGTHLPPSVSRRISCALLSQRCKDQSAEQDSRKNNAYNG